MIAQRVIILPSEVIVPLLFIMSMCVLSKCVPVYLFFVTAKARVSDNRERFSLKSACKFQSHEPAFHYPICLAKCFSVNVFAIANRDF